MAAFGLGTLPSMVSATVAFERAAKLLASRATLRNVAGSLLLAFGAWTAGSAVYHLIAHGAHGGRPDHDMSSMGDPADPHAGHDMSATGDPSDPHAGHDTGAAADTSRPPQ
jgi:ABC-type nickel/cobalt efflux system permease component RcnA